MGKTLHICLDDLLRDVARRDAIRRARVGLRLVDDGALPTAALPDEESLFADHDRWLGRGDGFFAEDPRELATRRLDMRGPLDRDPGPIEMEEAGDERVGVVLDLRAKR